MRIYLLSKNAVMVDCWYAYFSSTPEVSIICDDLKQFMQTYKVDCVVSPANSYGLMDGGFDLAISEYFGWELQNKVKRSD